MKSVEASDFGPFAFFCKVHEKIFVDDAIGGGEECEDVLDEVLLVLAQLLPVLAVVLRKSGAQIGDLNEGCWTPAREGSHAKLGQARL